MTDWGKSGRRDTYTFVYVDPFTLAETGEVAQVESGSSQLTWNYEGENILSGSLTFINEPQTIMVRLPDGKRYAMAVDSCDASWTLRNQKSVTISGQEVDA